MLIHKYLFILNITYYNSKISVLKRDNKSNQSQLTTLFLVFSNRNIIGTKVTKVPIK